MRSCTVVPSFMCRFIDLALTVHIRSITTKALNFLRLFIYSAFNLIQRTQLAQSNISFHPILLSAALSLALPISIQIGTLPLISETYGSSRRNVPSTRTPRHKACSKAPTQGRYISLIEEFTVTETLPYTRALY
ncbi:hypothetical protein PTI98_012787 [Pleurotus ostreatus]|nr:hypothetical protein PTI98_012787 [Pleurotus ostreatus]